MFCRPSCVLALRRFQAASEVETMTTKAIHALNARRWQERTPSPAPSVSYSRRFQGVDFVHFGAIGHKKLYRYIHDGDFSLVFSSGHSSSTYGKVKPRHDRIPRDTCIALISILHLRQSRTHLTLGFCFVFHMNVCFHQSPRHRRRAEGTT